MKPLPRAAALTFGLILALACSMPRSTPVPPPPQEPQEELPAPAQPVETLPPEPTPTETPPPTPTPEPPTPTKIPHSLIPPDSVKLGKITVVDAVSADTAAEKRAPYGDSYKYNWFERPFLQDMTYVPDLDLASYNLAYDEKFYYISIGLVGSNPNNPIGIDYGVELDLNADGYGDYIIIARPPHSVEWTTENVQVWEDTNQDTGGLSAERSDAPLPGDGYDTLIFDGGRRPEDDPDLAWMRINAGPKAAVQFAFKRALAGSKFLFGVIVDGGLRSIADLDYVDRFTEEEAGSPEKSEAAYPLKAVFGVDNACREAFGFTGTGQEPQRCKPK